ncbi:MAG: glycosyltransferase [Anaeromyxobacter sp.]|nr:glycosyltransferase [Anaeromyxobacter sp.]MBL0276092.1 glycosyltransferase [Anaeromyxobacter sp.]
MAARLSLCMILRDEEELLPRFLDHARGLWDELVAVDTGSTDRTPRLLEAAGARLLRREWTGDFSAARNVSLEAASGDWVVVLDADELVSPELVASARAVLEDQRAGAATVLMRNRLPHGHLRETRLLRLFRRDPAILFRHAVHEDVGEAVRAYLGRTGRRQVHLDGFVDHLGYVRARASARDKKGRDVALLEKVLAADPADLYAHFKRLEQARFWGDRGLWWRAAGDAVAAIRAYPEPLRTAHFGGELVALVADGLHRGVPGQALAFLDVWAGRVRPSAAFHLRRAELNEALGRPAVAAAEFERCRALAGETQNLQLATVRPLLGLARLALARGDVEGALARTEEALELAPRDPEALLAAVALHRARGGARGVAAFASVHGAAWGHPPELHDAVGEGALLAGDLPLALEALPHAAGKPPSGRAGLRLGVALLASGDAAAARELARRLTPELPEAALLELLADLAEGRSSDLSVDLEPDEADRALRPMVAALAASALPAVRAALWQGAPELVQLFPWLPSALAPRG